MSRSFLLYNASFEPGRGDRGNIPEPGNFSVPHLNIVVGWSWLIAVSRPARRPGRVSYDTPGR
jgi:hypothetical protein